MISPKLGRVRSGSRRDRNPSGLWLRLAIGSIVIHGGMVAMLLTVSDRASEAHRASVEGESINPRGAIEIDVIAVSGSTTPSNANGVLQPSALTTAAAPPSSRIETPKTPEIPATSSPSRFVDHVENFVTQTPKPDPTLSPAPASQPASTPTVWPSPTTQPVVTPPTNHSNDPKPTSGTGDEDPDEKPGDNDSDDTNTGEGEDSDTSNGSDRLGLIIRLLPLTNDTTDPDRRPAQLTAPVANLDISSNADPTLLPKDLAPPLTIALQVELSIDPTGIPSLVRILEPEGDRELPQFEPLVATLIEDWRFDPASSVANGNEVDQLDVILVLQWR